MSKKLILGLALAVVLVSGSLFSAQAAKDNDRPNATCQGEYKFGPSTPNPLGAPSNLPIYY
ncbi:MAG: hypothetical protein ACLQVJ_16860 [Syntrophobacteraceae bacterium]